jgi:uncharacterized membrane protein required for colicin V production
LGWIIDLIMVLLLILIVYASYRKGFLRSVLSLGGFLLATVVSFIFGKMLAEMLFDSMAKPWLTTLIDEQIVAGTNHNLAVVVDNMYQNLPGYLSGPLEMLLGSKEQVLANLQSALDGGSVGLTDAIVGLLRPMLVALLSVLTIIILFLVCMIVIRIVDRLLIQVRRIPVIGTFDGLLGGLVGIVKAVIWLVILVFLVKAVILLSADGISWLNSGTVESSFLFKYLYHVDIPQVFEGLSLGG